MSMPRLVLGKVLQERIQYTEQMAHFAGVLQRINWYMLLLLGHLGLKMSDEMRSRFAQVFFLKADSIEQGN